MEYEEEESVYKVRKISNREDFFAAKAHTLEAILEDLILGDTELEDLSCIMEDWMCAWTEAEVESEVINPLAGKTEVENDASLENLVDNFAGRLVEFQIGCKDKVIEMYKEKVNRLQKAMSKSDKLADFKF